MMPSSILRSDLTGEIDELNTYDWNGDTALKEECIALAEGEITEAFLARSASTSRLGDTNSPIEFTVGCDDADRVCCTDVCVTEGFCRTHVCRFRAGDKVLKTWNDRENYSFNLINGWSNPDPRGPYTCRDVAGKCTVLEAESPLKSTPSDQFDKALELVFGKEPSPGLLCGIASSVADTSTTTTIGGTCCLDTPAESLDNWGQPVSYSSFAFFLP